MALKVKILEENNKIIAKGVLDGTVPFLFEDSGDRWSVRIGKTWRHMERERHSKGQPLISEARQKIYGAIARFRCEAKPALA
ncbi:hypothetical protein [Tabrizicola caldifontis]|uniref:hypothetical protein n=1 Tax=Tabrizicola caldifontis TaxID=2528036 RepID=UPI001081AD54|nr:hypothetical protein [Rhodobacter sp. YIM 73028]